MNSGAMLFDRDGTLIADCAGAKDPHGIRLMPTAREALGLAREAGWRVGVVTNQPGVDAGVLARLHARIEDLLGPIDGWFVCRHLPDAGCICRKPQPGLIHAAAAALDIPVSACVVIGDIGSDIDAARAAGARSMLVPTGVTRIAEIEAAAPHVAPTLLDAVRTIARASS